MSHSDNNKKPRGNSTKRVAEIAGGVASKGVGAYAAVTATTGLVGALGTASTGTAISTLSGAAASNATLAWLGGGALAAGGGGIVVGTAVLVSIGFAGSYCAKKAYGHVLKNTKDSGKQSS